MAIVTLSRDDCHLKLPGGRTTIKPTGTSKQVICAGTPKSPLQPDLNRYAALSEGQVVPEASRAVCSAASAPTTAPSTLTCAPMPGAACPFTIVTA